ncbi:helix-turn-helix domain-containing protein [Myxococcota bacterium]|nr:helix-turn-helix domain-containing protein [Myxococcota bacterium]
MVHSTLPQFSRSNGASAPTPPGLPPGMMQIPAAVFEGLMAKIMELERERTELCVRIAQAQGLERKALDVEQIAALLGVSRATVDRWIARGKIPVFELPQGIETTEKAGKYRILRAWNTDIVEHFRARPVTADDDERPVEVALEAPEVALEAPPPETRARSSSTSSRPTAAPKKRPEKRPEKRERSKPSTVDAPPAPRGPTPLELDRMRRGAL